MRQDNWTFNRGEWSEAYTFLKLLSDGKLHAADAQLNKLPDRFYPILQILRTELGEELEYTLDGTVVRIAKKGAYQPLLELPVNSFTRQSEHLLREMKGGSGALSVPKTANFLRKIHVSNPKSSSGDKRDITIVIHDPLTGDEPTLGFSIKSQLGGPSTLFSPSRSSNFIYRVRGPRLSDDEIREINALTNIAPRIQAVRSKGCQFSFMDVQGETLSLNMQLIDTALPRIFGELLLAAYRSEELRVGKGGVIWS